MLTVYLDESMEPGDSNVVVSGFMGNKPSWVRCVRAWRRVLRKHDRTSIHLKELRLKERHREMLRELGEVPSRCGLRRIFASVNVGAYKPSVSGTVMEIASQGYLYAFMNALLSALNCVPDGQRLEVICESQIEFAERRENICVTCSMLPEYKNRHGRSKLAKWSSIPKSTILEPADYAAFALLQHLRDPDSLKASLCAPILNNGLSRGICQTDERSREIMAELMQEQPSFQEPVISPENRKAFIKQLPKGEDFRKQMAKVIANAQNKN